MNVPIQDEFLWRILAIIGINLSNYRLKAYEKILSWMIKSFISITSLHGISASIFLLFQKQFIAGLTYLLLPVELILIFLFLNRKRKSVTFAVLKLYALRKRFAKQCEKPFLLNGAIMIMIFLPLLISIFLQISFPEVRAKMIFGHLVAKLDYMGYFIKS